MSDRDLRIKLLFETLDRVSKPLKDIAGGSNRAARELKETRARLDQLESSTRDVTSFRGLKQDLHQTENRMVAAQARAKALGRELAQTATPTKKLAADFAKAKREAEKLEAQHRDETRALQSLRDKLNAAGVGTKNLVEHERRLRTETARATTEIEKQEKRLTRLADRNARVGAAKQGFGRVQDAATRSLGAGTAGVAAGVTTLAPMAVAAKDAMAFEDVMADVKKVVDFEAPGSFEKMSGDILDLSTRLPMSAEGIGQIVAAAGRSNVARDQLLAFAESAAKMGVAFDMSAEDAGSTMAKWRTAFGLGQDGVVSLADQVNALTNKFGGNVGAVTEMVTRIGPLGKVAGVAAPQIAAMGQLLDKVGIESEVGATGIKNMMLALTKGSAATKSQSKAFQALGLDAVAVSKAMQKDAGGTIMDVLRRLQRLPKDVQAGALTNLFGSESVAAIAPMLTSIDQLKKNFELVGDAANYAGSMEKEYAARSGTTSNQLQLARNNFDALKITVGTELLPTITALAQSLGEVASRFRAWAQQNPGTVKVIAGLVAGFGALMIVFGGLAIMLAGVIAPFAPLIAVSRLTGTTVPKMLLNVAKSASPLLKVFPLLGRGAMMLASTMMRAGMMLLANPVILAIVALVAALALAGYLIWTHWDTIHAAFSGAMAWLAGIGASISGAVSGAINSIVGFVSTLWPRMKGHLIGWIVYLSPLPNMLLGIGRNMIQGLINGITGMLGRLKSTIVNAAGSAANWFKSKLGIRSPSRVFAGFGDFMMQGLEGGLAAGEDGPLRRVDGLSKRLAAAIAIGAATPAIAAGAAASGVGSTAPGLAGASAGDSFTFHVYGAPGQSPQDIARAVRAELEKVEREKRARGNSSYADAPDWSDR